MHYNDYQGNDNLINIQEENAWEHKENQTKKIRETQKTPKPLKPPKPPIEKGVIKSKALSTKKMRESIMFIRDENKRLGITFDKKEEEKEEKEEKEEIIPQETPSTWSTPRIGFIGFGVVNQAIYYNMITMAKERVVVYSKEEIYQDNQTNILGTDLTIITVPTNHEKTLEDTLMNINTNLLFLAENNYKGIIVIKSTCLPKDINNICSQFPNFKKLRIVYSPEFLDANSAKEDFYKEDIILGGDIKTAEEVLKIFKSIFKFSVQDATFLTADEAMEFKLYRNIYAMYKYVFFNNIPYLFDTDPRILQGLLKSNPILDENLRIGMDGKLGVGGDCLPKDNLNMIQSYADQKDIQEEDFRFGTSSTFDASAILKTLDDFNRNFRTDLPEVNPA